MAVFNHVSFDEHEQVVFCHDKESGLKAIIAVHNTNKGPAVGGCRMWNYQSDYNPSLIGFKNGDLKHIKRIENEIFYFNTSIYYFLWG